MFLHFLESACPKRIRQSKIGRQFSSFLRRNCTRVYWKLSFNGRTKCHIGTDGAQPGDRTPLACCREFYIIQILLSSFKSNSLLDMLFVDFGFFMRVNCHACILDWEIGNKAVRGNSLSTLNKSTASSYLPLQVCFLPTILSEICVLLLLRLCGRFWDLQKSICECENERGNVQLPN